MVEEAKERKVILIAEDDLTSRLIMEGFIQKLGYRSISATNGLEAWQILSGARAPSLALIDWEMPEMDGLEVIRKVRKELQDRFIYLIMVTGKSTKEEIIEGIEQGADDYVAKPFDTKELDVRIRGWNADYSPAAKADECKQATGEISENRQSDRFL